MALLAIGAAVVLGVVALGIGMWRGVGAEPTGETGAPFAQAPDFTLPDFDGGTFTLSAHESGPIFLYFWASWCVPCQEEAPVLQAAWPEYKARGYMFVGVNIIDDEQDARDFIARYGLTFPNIRDERGAVYVDYGVYGVPESFFLRRGREIETKFLGALTEERLASLLDRLEAPP